ncbi:MAG: hypothetical protein M1274_10485 [Actinobacteria bacterium]|nr:hypothetical protein [Actinomycetota bacterium]
MLSEKKTAGPGQSRPRSIIAYEFARGLIYIPPSAHPDWSPVRTGMARLDLLRALGEISDREHHEIGRILGSLEGCDMDQCLRIEDLMEEITRDLTVWVEHYPDERLKRLEQLVALRGAIADVP